jgi:cold shock CspA family protein
LESLLYPEGQPSFDELQGLYWREYQRWMKGPFKPLYESDKTAFKVRFSDFLNQQMDTDTHTYILRLLEDVVKNRKLLPCVIFDNTDHFVDPNYQEAIFQFSQSLHESVPFTLIVMPITDRSLWRLSKAGPLQTYSSKMFYLPVPPTKEVLEKRVAYLKRKIEEEKDQHSYFFAKGIRLTIENIRGFAACLEELFLNADFVSRRISWLANNNLRKCLELTQKLILSPIFSVEDLVKAFIVHGSVAALRLDSRKFMQALLHGNYNAFQQDHNTFIFNLFAISPYFPTTPFLNLGILKLLIDRTGDDAGISGYISLEQVSQYFLAMGVSEPALDHTLSLLLSFRLVEPYDASDETLANTQRIAITHSGRMHYELAMTDQYFVGDMAFATPVRSFPLVEKLRTIRSTRMGEDEWSAVQSLFFKYCFEQDSLYVKIPVDEIYDGQRLLRAELKNRWIENKQVSASAVEARVEPGVSHASAIVKWYNPAKGYGFADANLSEQAFFHRNQLQQAKIETVSIGDTLICDIAPGPKGKLQVIAVHSIQTRQPTKASPVASETQIEGVVEFYNAKKGYGFIKSPALNEDVYVSSKVLEQHGLEFGCSGQGQVRGTHQRAGR